MSTTTVLTATCPCGARLDATGNWSDVSFEHARFTSAHQVCRERERPLVMWGGDGA